MDKFVVKEFKNRFWQIAEVYKNGKKIAQVNKFYEVTHDWIVIYDTVGGSGTGFNKGEILNKFFIGDSEFSKEYL